MTVYELRTYTLHVGKMGEAVKLYSEFDKLPTAAPWGPHP